ncbi:Holliday junction ATP-dependent DNA helicase RuvB [Methanimicrococcus sp. At1]|uniref:Replication factor C small subunit n=1 Tax=Methanimicrococcus hacksteinii TaxID=3028293 RepID=A0ABU3VP00_9EURY|nr:replication factor C small subunit [Methanimicrococcus sp. At1]MDV0445126.1 Holliday junction ATP-dependent DNA helicase RuvB [Methanimicrococcus sp. At1]
MREEIWVEKYRPMKLDDVFGQDETVERLKSYVRSKNLPHLLFTGPPGVGKTASAVSIAREMFGEYWNENFTELNASDERGIDVVRNKIKTFAKTAPIGGASFKIIFLDEADALTNDAQSALRRTMEKYSGNCRFILSCNYSSKIIEPIQSRCAIYRFRSLTDEAIEKRVKYIAEQENLTITDDGMKALVYVAGGDMRKAVNSLQAAAFIQKDIDEETIYKITATARPEDVLDLIQTALAGEFKSAREKLNVLVFEQGLSADDVMNQIYRALFKIEDLNDSEMIQLIDAVGETDFRITEGANEKIQLEALIAHFALLRKNN